MKTKTKLSALKERFDSIASQLTCASMAAESISTITPSDELPSSLRRYLCLMEVDLNNYALGLSNYSEQIEKALQDEDEDKN